MKRTLFKNNLRARKFGGKCSDVLLIFALLIPLSLQPSASAGGTAKQQIPDIYPAEEVTSGLRGVGYTSFKGNELEEFEFEVLGVLRSWAPKGQIFLVELEHPVTDEGGVIAGMSGSPLYVGGRLLGAVAYGFSFSLRPIAGVTPAEEMFVPVDIHRSRAGENDYRSAKASARSYIDRRTSRMTGEILTQRRSSDSLRIQLLDTFISAPWQTLETYKTQMDIDSLQTLSPIEKDRLPNSSLRPLPMPLSFSGFDLNKLGDLRSILQPANMPAVQALGTHEPAPVDLEEDLQPGVPIGVSLMTGDMDVSGMGTLTFIDGNLIAAYGHPMSEAGDTDLPMALGHVETVLPSRFLSFKLSSSRQIIGSITQDRASAIVGEIGRKAPMFPATINIKGVHDETYEYQLAGHWQFAPMMSLYAAAFSALRWEGDFERMTVNATARIGIKGREEPLIQENIYSAFNPVWPAFDLVMLPVQSIMMNRFKEVELDYIEVDYEIEEGINAATIEAVQLEKPEVSPGETLRMWVTLREYHGTTQVEELTLNIPHDAEPGKVAEIYVSDSATIMGLAFEKDPGLMTPKTFEGLIESLEVSPKNTRLYAHANFIKRGVRYKDARMPDLPGSVINMLEHGTIAGETTPLIEDVQNSVDTPWVLQGNIAVNVKIQSKK